MITTTAAPPTALEIAASLNQVLADSYALIAANDAESQDLMIERITMHQKTIWMLKSFLKP